MCKNLSPTKTRRGNCLILPHTGPWWFRMATATSTAEIYEELRERTE